MTLGHDVLIRTKTNYQTYSYRFLIDLIGRSYPKEKPKETFFKNGIRVIWNRCNKDGFHVSKKQIKKWAQTRRYLTGPAFVADFDVSRAIYRALLSCLSDIPVSGKLLRSIFEIIKRDNEKYTHRLTVLSEIYRELCNYANTDVSAQQLCNILIEVDEIYFDL